MRVGVSHPVAPVKRIRTVVAACLVLSLAACSGKHLAVELPGGGETLELTFVVGEAAEHELPFRVSGGRPPYEATIEGCPDWVNFFPDQGVLAGVAPVLDTGRTFFCTYRVAESDPGFRPARTVTYGLRLTVDPLDRGAWRFRTRTIEPGGPCALPVPGESTPVAILPHAQGGEVDRATYRLIDLPNDGILSFDPRTRQLTHTHASAAPILGTPNTYRYLVGREGVDSANADDALCLDIQYNPGSSASCAADPPLEPGHYIHIQLQVRDDAFWDESAGEYRCPDRRAPEPASTGAALSNSVHTALTPVHARRALDVAHGSIRDRVADWSPAAPRVRPATTPAVSIGTLSGESEGFDYSGSSESLSAVAELGEGSWQTGLIAAFTRTELHYRAISGLAEHGYHSGEHDTEIFSVHPFAAWHMASGGHLWASLGAGTGRLRHRDGHGFPSWSRSDVRLRAHAAGVAVPVTALLSGELRAEAGIESFAFEIAGGDQISSALPTMRGHDYRAGLKWASPVPDAPSLSVAYKHLTGDGPDGGHLEAKGFVSIAGLFDSRLSLTGSAEASVGVGDYEHDFWGLGVGVRYAPGESRRGFGLAFDTRLMSLDNGLSSGFGMRGEVSYGLHVGPFVGTMRPYVGLGSNSADGSLQRSLGFDLLDTPRSQAKIEVREFSRDRSRTLRLGLHHRF